MNLNNILNGVNLKSISNMAIDSDTRHLPRRYFDGAIIFCKTDFIPMLFAEISSHNNSYKLITGLSDYAITEEKFKLKPSCIKKWYAPNAEFKHKDLVPIPLGLENHNGPPGTKGYWTDWGLWQEYNLTSIYPKGKKIFNNFCLTNHPLRESWAGLLENIGFHFTKDKVNYRAYIEEVKQHFLVSSPRGNGLDCHRTWEALYFNAIPIVPKHFIYDAFDLPIVQVKELEDITTDFIENLIYRYENNEFEINKEVLTADYWRNKILKDDFV